MTERSYLLDSNFMIQAGRYYPKDIFPSFWEKFQLMIENGTVVIHETVLDEILRNEDELAEWMNNIPRFEKIEIGEKAFNKYLEMCEWVKNPQRGYSDTAISKFENNHSADAWICAECAVSGYILVTNEKLGNSLNNVKIPNVCQAFEIEYMNAFDFMREQGFLF